MNQIVESAGEPVQGTADSESKPTKTRWWILFLMALVYLICSMDRGNLSVAAPEVAKEFHLSKTAMGVVLAAFTWTYAIGQVPVGWLGDRYGPRKVLTIIMYGVGLAPILNGLAVGMNSLLCSRLFLGIVEAGCFPVASRGMQMWFHRSERGRVQGITHALSSVAVAVTPPIAAAILYAWGWRAIFYVFGSFGIIWAIAFSIIFRDTPEEHKGVNRAELAEIRGVNPDGSIKPLAISKRPKVPWSQILRSRNMLWIALGYCCFFFGTNFYLTWYPSYLREYRHMSLAALGVFGMIPPICGMLGCSLGGALTDSIFKKTGNAKFARRVVAAPGFLLAGLFVLPAALTNNPFVSLFCLAAAFFSLETVMGPAWAVPMDVGGQYSGTITGTMNMAGAMAASLTPVVYGSLFDRGHWIAPFFVTTGVMFIGALFWVFLINPEESVVEASA